MLKLIFKGHNFEYEIKELLKAMGHVEGDNTSWRIESVFCQDKSVAGAMLYNDDKLIQEHFEKVTELDKKSVRNSLKRTIFKTLSSIDQKEMPWGILTGIRPAKLAMELIDEDLQDYEILKELQEKYLMSKEKASLITEVARSEKKFLTKESQDKISLYISIPFCPTRCLYCSFPSNDLKTYGKYREEYLKALFLEIDATKNIIERMGKKLETVYVGGGTPTALEASSIQRLLSKIEDTFDLGGIREFTYEAGRPDSLDEDKLKAIYNSSVDRISINPQTFNDNTLELIGRNHRANEVEEAIWKAREIGFDNINMDIILGLPKETSDDVKYTLEKIQNLKPDSLTVHTLAIKRASKLKETLTSFDLVQYNEVNNMIRMTREAALSMGLRPYYLYRQKNILGNLENVGYSLLGRESVYNIQIMEEKQTIFALGAGAISKFVYPKENRIERVANVKNLEQYIDRVQEMIERKEKEVFGK